MRCSSRWPILAVRTGLLVCLLAILAAPLQQQSGQRGASSEPTASPAPQATANPAEPQFFVLIDPSHGGDDKGAVFSPRVLEKDVTLAFARVLRKQLEEREISSRLLRDSDVNLSLDHRAELCNQQRPGVYIALHAGTPGSGVRVYTAFMPVRQQAVGGFVPWDGAQTASLERSAAIAKEVMQELKKKDLKSANLQAFLRPLNNVLSPAIAIEVAADAGNLHSLENLKLQETVASAVVSAIEETRVHAGGPK
jgi:N-acetylmuramoyl-L-alanine amidase